MNSLSFGCNSPLSTNKHHSTGGWHEIGGIDPVALLFFHHHRANIDTQIVIRSAFSQQRSQVVIVLAEKAGAQLAVRGQPNARAVSAERLSDRSNQTDFARSAVGETVLARGLAALVRN